MNASRKTIAAFLAALTFASAIPVTSAFACGGGRCGYYGGGHHYGYGYGYYGWNYGAGALVAGAIAAPTSCVTYRPVYNRYGNYLGQQAVTVC
jgi:hypothetical protein